MTSLSANHQSEVSWHFKNGTLPVRQRQICAHRNDTVPASHGFETPLRRTITTGTDLMKPTSPLPLKWAMV